MSIQAIFNHPQNGYDHHQKWCVEAGLVVGQSYNVTNAVVSNYHTNVYLEGFTNPFNSVHFDFMSNGRPVDIVAIYKDMGYYD